MKNNDHIYDPLNKLSLDELECFVSGDEVPIPELNRDNQDRLGEGFLEGKINNSGRSKLTLRQRGELARLKGLLISAYQYADRPYPSPGYLDKIIGDARTIITGSSLTLSQYLPLITELMDQCSQRIHKEDDNAESYGTLSLLAAGLAEHKDEQMVCGQKENNPNNHLQKSELARLEDMLEFFYNSISICSNKDQLITSAKEIDDFLCGSSLSKKDYLPIIRKTVDLCLKDSRYFSKQALVLSRYFHLDEDNPIMFGDFEHELKKQKHREEQKKQNIYPLYIMGGIVGSSILLFVTLAIINYNSADKSEDYSGSYSQRRVISTPSVIETQTRAVYNPENEFVIINTNPEKPTLTPTPSESSDNLSPKKWVRVSFEPAW